MGALAASDPLAASDALAAADRTKAEVESQELTSVLPLGRPDSRRELRDLRRARGFLGGVAGLHGLGALAILVQVGASLGSVDVWVPVWLESMSFPMVLVLALVFGATALGALSVASAVHRTERQLQGRRRAPGVDPQLQGLEVPR